MTEGDLFSYRDAAKALSTRELEDIIRHHSSFSSDESGLINPPSPHSRRGESSKAYVSAMKALQDKLQTSNQEISTLKHRVAYLEGKESEEAEKLRAEAKSHVEKENVLKHKLASIEEEARSLLQENLRLKEQLKIK